MSAISHSRGHAIYFDGKAWRYLDNNNLLQNEERPCFRCGKYPTPEGYDACLEYVKGMKSACCGHGITKELQKKDLIK